MAEKYNACIAGFRGPLSKLYVSCALVDTVENLRKQAFKKHKVKFIKFFELIDNTGNYKICKGIILFPNPDALNEALEDLERRALICGHPDYIEVSSDAIRMIVENTERRQQK